MWTDVFPDLVPEMAARRTLYYFASREQRAEEKSDDHSKDSLISANWWICDAVGSQCWSFPSLVNTADDITMKREEQSRASEMICVFFWRAMTKKFQAGIIQKQRTI